MDRIEPKIYSQIVDSKGNKTMSPLKSIPFEEVKLRYEYLKYSYEFHDIYWELKSKSQLLMNLKDHIERTKKEANKSISDKEILDAIQKMRELPLKGKLKEIATNLANEFLTGNVVGIQNRFDYITTVKNFIDQNS